MEKKATFGDADLARKMAAQFGATSDAVNVEMRYVAEVKNFVKKIEEAHRKAAESQLIFG